MTEIDHGLSEKILINVKAHPEHFDMDYWVTNKAEEFAGQRGFQDETGALTCGTTLCAAGWASFLTTGKVERYDISGRGRELLGLNSSTLFYTTNEIALAALEHMVDPASTPESVDDLVCNLEAEQRALGEEG